MSNEILYIAHYFAPYSFTPAIRAVQIAKRLKEHGYKIHVINVKNDKLYPKDYRTLREVKSPLINIVNISYFTFPFRALEYVLKKISTKFDFFMPSFILHWIPHSFLRIRKLIKKNNIKVIYTTAPPYFSLFLGYLLKKAFHIPLVIEYRDPWTFNPYTINNTSKLYKKLFGSLERRIIKNSDAVLTVSEAMNGFLLKYFPEVIAEEKITVISSGLNLDEASKYTAFKGSQNEIRFTFTGFLYGMRDITPLIRIVADVKKKDLFPDIKFRINIFGKYDYHYLSETIEKNQVEDIFHLGGYISHEECYNELSSSTFPLHVGENLDYPTISFKVWEYLAMRKKIVYLGREDSFTAQFLQQHDLGFTIPINDHVAGVMRFIELIEGIKSDTLDLEVSSDQLKEFTWDRIVDKLDRVFQEVIKRT